MNILFDYQIFVAQKFGGISRYFVDLITGVEMTAGFSANLEVVGNKNHYLPKSYLKEFSLLEKLKKYPSKMNKVLRKNQRITLGLLEKADIDVFHPTYYDPYFVDRIKKPMIITIHDMIYENFPHLFSPDEPIAYYKRLHIERADHIIAVSQRTKEDILKYYPLDDSKITVVHHGIDLESSLYYQNIADLPQNYILYVGGRYGYKNFELLVQAFSVISSRYDDLKLVVTGSPFGMAEQELLFRNNVQDKILILSANDDQLNTLYKNALFFIYPSLYEGFGLPILEAYKNECPVLLSKASCFPEVAAEAAAYFDPLSVESLMEQMELLLGSQAFRNQLVKAGKARLQNYSMKSCVYRTTEVYKSLL